MQNTSPQAAAGDQSSRMTAAPSSAGTAKRSDGEVVRGWPIPGVPDFVPARGLFGGNLQTVVASLFPGKVPLPGTVPRHLRLPDDDRAVLHDDMPGSWQRGDHVVLLLHGLSGSHQSGYMVRLAARLVAIGVRVFRMDHRGCGAAAQLARSPYHAGRTEDIAAAVAMLERLCPGSPISIAGFSLSGNILLKYLGDNAENLPFCLYRAVAVCPPVDLHQCTARLAATAAGQRYDWYFTRRLLSQIVQTTLWRDELPLAQVKRLPRRMYEFDDLYTAPVAGFASVDDYYTQTSSLPVLGRIRVHTTILASQDDPVVCPQPLIDAALPPNVTLCLTPHGGHLGFIGRAGLDPDRRWMDWRLTEWLLE
ncbi:MAG: YheT family hydrolase [Planctomyces sp.]|jgi:predicted alpha/beta-fold hydrolase|nr:alpha/beta fold hydrolase [Planctomyces sp.]